MNEPVILMDRIEDPKLYSTYLIVCALLQNIHEDWRVPEAVGLSYERKNLDIAFVPIKAPQLLDPSIRSVPLRDELAVCIPAILNHYNDALRIVEFVEFYRLLGATKFYFYKWWIGDNVDKVLTYYKEAGVAEVFEWRLYGQFFKKSLTKNLSFFFVADYKFPEIFYAGISACFHDCYYR